MSNVDLIGKAVVTTKSEDNVLQQNRKKSKTERYKIYGHSDGRLEIMVMNDELKKVLRYNEMLGDNAIFARVLPRSLKKRPLKAVEFVNPEDVSEILMAFERIYRQRERVKKILVGQLNGNTT